MQITRAPKASASWVAAMPTPPRARVHEHRLPRRQPGAAQREPRGLVRDGQGRDRDGIEPGRVRHHE
ncbi:hypothetical protein [Streptosporangium vulgare]|uniref:hypothetical protein n=1 Tax=Streptosporangium vulgare TaxID=46190 RepID=UPI0031CF14D9